MLPCGATVVCPYVRNVALAIAEAKTLFQNFFSATQTQARFGFRAVAASGGVGVATPWPRLPRDTL